MNLYFLNKHKILNEYIFNFKKLYIKPVTLWFTGLPASGKTTLAKALYEIFKTNGNKVIWLDGDKIRRTISKDLGFSKKDRIENIKRIAHLAQCLNEEGAFVIVSAIAPYKEMRQIIREIVNNYVEVYVKCPLEICKKRDPKGLYKKAEKGEIKNFTGISDTYEEPEAPDILVETKESVDECIGKILNSLCQFL